MSAIVTILNAEKEKSIQMNLDPEETINEIIQKCEDYWLIGYGSKSQDRKEEYSLLKGDMVLNPEKTVISCDIQDGDVLKFVKGFSIETPVQEDESRDVKQKIERDESVMRAKRWLEDNIGVESRNLRIVDEKNWSDEEKDQELVIIFKEGEKGDHFTVKLKDGWVKKYIPVKTSVEKV